MFRYRTVKNVSTIRTAVSRVYHRNFPAATSENFLSPRRRGWSCHNVPCQRYHVNPVNPVKEQERNAAYLSRHGDVPLVDETIGNLLETAAERWPNEECVVSLHQDVRLTFSQLILRADRLAAGLMKLGLEPGDRLGVWGPNDVEWMITFMAATRAGFILVAINPSYQMDELTYCLRKVGVKAVIAAENLKTQDYSRMLLEARQTCPTLEHVIVYSKDHVTGTRRFNDVEALASRTEVERISKLQDQISCQSGINVQFTSGTTGRPKATLLSQYSMVNNSKQGVLRSELKAGQKVCLQVPFFHAFGTIKGLLGMLHAGVTLVLPGRTFNPVKSMNAILRENCDIVYGTPTMWINLLDVCQRLQPPPITLACGITGGSPASPKLIKTIREYFNFDNIKTIYGLTETTAIVFHSLPNEEHALTENMVGHLTNHCEVMVVDENGKVVPFGTTGELWVRGYCVMKKYWNDEEATKKTFGKGGWFKTGDLFVLRPDGYAQIVGRAKDMLIRGGENIFPKEIEDVLMTHPLVVEAQVIGAYDEVYGEEVCACVRLRSGASLSKEELREYCKGRMAGFKIPRYVEFVTEYPKTVSGKVQKHKLREEMERLRVIPTSPTT